MGIKYALYEEDFEKFKNAVIKEIENDYGKIITTKKLCMELNDDINDWLGIYKRIVKIQDKPPECQHKYKDYDWYLEYEVPNNKNIFKYRIFEPYVCLLCGDRKNVKLEEGIIPLNERSYYDILEMMRKSYPKIRNRADIEDEIQDDIHVDKEYLKWHEFLRNGGSVQDQKIELKL